LRDVLGWNAREAADVLGQSVPAIKSALHRGRTTLAQAAPQAWAHTLPEGAANEARRRQLERYVRAWEAADIPGLLALLKAEAAFSMPPAPEWRRGPEAIGALVAATVFAGEGAGRWRLHPTRANGRPAFGLYRRDRAGQGYRAYGLQVVSFDGDQIADIVTFRDPSLISYFDLPAALPNR
jgi:RNA polymerase sigma-70 factor (ECF subfamily)